MTRPSATRRFCSDSEGTVAIVFSLCFIVLMCMTGLAVDAARAYKAENALTQALDSTSLATAKALRSEGLEESQLEDRAKLVFNENFKNRSSQNTELKDLKVTLDKANDTVTVSADITIPSLIARLLRRDDFVISRTSQAQFATKNVELSLTLDTSGSMSGEKLADLKAAANDLLKIVLQSNESGAKNRIGIAPYSTSVNAGGYADKATGKSAKNDCVSERPGKASDQDPKGKPLGRKASDCPSGEIVPLSDDQDKLKARIEAMQADGSTAGHLGIAWSWYILSPNWKSFWPGDSEPKPYDDKETIKAAVILTDGIFNTEYEHGNGNSVAQAKELCDGMKDDKIIVFTIGFQAPEESKETLKYCASAEQYFFDAQEGGSLRAAFSNIAGKLVELRISK